MHSCNPDFKLKLNISLQVFYYTHMLIGPAWILLVLHSHEFWCWFLVPGIMYIISVVVRSRMYVTWKYGTTKINEVVLLPSEVTHLGKLIMDPVNWSEHLHVFALCCIVVISFCVAYSNPETNEIPILPRWLCVCEHSINCQKRVASIYNIQCTRTRR